MIQGMTPVGCQVGLSVTNATAVGLTVPAGAKAAVISIETAPVRYRDDGVAPTATNGVLLLNPTGTAEQPPWVYNTTAKGLSQLRLIAQSGTATVNACFYG